MPDPLKDGVPDQLWPVVEARDWQEAIALNGEYLTYRCADGWTVTFGGKFEVKEAGATKGPRP